MPKKDALTQYKLKQYIKTMEGLTTTLTTFKDDLSKQGKTVNSINVVVGRIDERLIQQEKDIKFRFRVLWTMGIIFYGIMGTAGNFMYETLDKKYAMLNARQDKIISRGCKIDTTKSKKEI